MTDVAGDRLPLTGHRRSAAEDSNTLGLYCCSRSTDFRQGESAKKFSARFVVKIARIYDTQCHKRASLSLVDGTEFRKTTVTYKNT